jgi:TRAP-type C4-dicarboxylate transport system permease small subunit
VIRRAIAHFEEIVGSTLLVAITLIASVQIAGRYLLSEPFAWTEELATFLFAWIVFVGASLALKRREHFALEIVVDRLHGAARRIADTCILTAVIIFSILLIWLGVRLSVSSWTVKTAAMEMPRTWLYASVPAGGLLMLARSVEQLVAVWRRAPETAPSRDGGAEGPAR